MRRDLKCGSEFYRYLEESASQKDSKNVSPEVKKLLKCLRSNKKAP